MLMMMHDVTLADDLCVTIDLDLLNKQTGPRKCFIVTCCQRSMCNSYLLPVNIAYYFPLGAYHLLRLYRCEDTFVATVSL